MERINQFSFYQIGKNFGALEQFGGGDVLAAKAVWPLMDARRTVIGLLQGKPLQLEFPAGARRH